MFSTLAFGLALTSPAEPLTLKVMTYNVRYATAPDGDNSWPNRREALIRLVKRHDPDVLGVQEALSVQIDELQAALPGHSILGVGREDGVRKGEYSAIFYRKEKFGLREGGTKWISDQPDKPGSIGPGAHIPRVFTWGEFFCGDGTRFLVLCAHLDHESPEARLMGTRHMRSFVESRPSLPSLVIGDFNSTVSEPPIQHLTAKNLFEAAVPSEGQTATFNAFDPNVTAGPMIDHVLHSKNWTVVTAEIDRTSENGRVPSDHFPLIVRLRMNAKD